MHRHLPLKNSVVAAALLGIVLALALLLPGDLAAQNATPTPRPTRVRAATRTPIPSLRATATVTPTATLIPTPAPLAFFILPAPSVKHTLVGDVIAPLDVPLSAHYPTLFGDAIALGMANLRDLTAGPEDGAGIRSVTFTILDLTGLVVHEVTAPAGAPFCAFGRDDSGDCAIHRFDEYSPVWPQGAAARSGRYTLVAFAQGAQDDHKGAWTLSFELRLKRDGLQESDGAARFRSVERDGRRLLLTIETFGFTPFARGTHLHIYPGSLREEEATADAPGVTVFPTGYEQPGAYDLVRMDVPMQGGYGAAQVCVAVVHPDGTLLPGRGECVDIP